MAAGPIAYGTAIIGGGVSGSSVLLALARVAEPGYRTVLFEPRRLGPGTAYAAPSETLLMNGGAGSMSLFPDDKRHLLRWLKSDDSHALVPRSQYGEYVARTVEDSLAVRPAFEHRAAEIVDIERHGTDYLLTDERGCRCVAENVVLALGNFAPDDSFLPGAVRSFVNYHGNPWRLNAARIDGDVAIVGSRLTAMDVLALLDENDFSGRIYLISRHGLMPEPEDPSVDGLDPDTLDLHAETPRDLLHSLRRAAERHSDKGGDWRAVVESLRSVSPAIWLRWNERERRRFLRHLHSFWAAHRYRVPSATHAAWLRRAETGQAQVVKGRIVEAVRINGNSLRMTVANAVTERHLDVQAVINAAGPNADYTRIDRPLVRNMLRRGMIRADQLRLGLDATADYRLLSSDGVVQSSLFTLGPPMRGVLYESTAVPEIARAARNIAAALCTAPLALGAAS